MGADRSNCFLGIPRAKRTSALPARVFDIAAGSGAGLGDSAPRWWADELLCGAPLPVEPTAASGALTGRSRYSIPGIRNYLGVV